MSDALVQSLHVYPVKGCRGIAVAAAEMAVTGLATGGIGDREFMVVDRDGRFVTQREVPRLALIEVEGVGGALRMSASGSPALTVPLPAASGAARDVVVWQHKGRAHDAGDAAASWLSAWLAADVRLVRFDRSGTRLCNTDYAGESGAHTYFADGYPILVIGQGSLAELNERLTARGHDALPMNRFRPNVVLQGLPPFAEDHIDTIAIGDIVLKFVKPCVRCKVATTDQRSAEVGLEPLRTLGEFRMDERMGGVTFGMNAIVATGAGRALAVGAPVTIDYRF